MKFSDANIMRNRESPSTVFKYQCDYAPFRNLILNSSGKHKAPVCIIADSTQFAKDRKVTQNRR